MKHGLIPTIQQGWFGQTIKDKTDKQTINRLLYATLEVPKVLPAILPSFVEKSFLNHTLIIMVT